MKVKATKEGLYGRRTSSGIIIDKRIPFVALPSVNALRRFVRVTNPLNNKSAIAIVADVGPWNGGAAYKPGTSHLIDTNDDKYVFGSERPQAESGTDMRGRPTNGAGIDLSDAIWDKLEMQDNTEIEWEFIDD